MNGRIKHKTKDGEKEKGLYNKQEQIINIESQNQSSLSSTT